MRVSPEHLVEDIERIAALFPGFAAEPLSGRLLELMFLQSVNPGMFYDLALVKFPETAPTYARELAHWARLIRRCALQDHVILPSHRGEKCVLSFLIDGRVWEEIELSVTDSHLFRWFVDRVSAMSQDECTSERLQEAG